jgi:hypothetical protein
MKRITFTLSPSLLAADDVDPLDLEFRLTSAILGLDASLESATIETVAHTGRTQTEPARPGLCRVGAHTFYAPRYFRADRDVPDICPDHSRAEEDAGVAELHRPLFEDITARTGLIPQIWHSGGGCMTIVIPLRTPEPGTSWAAPCYMGLQEGQDDDGRWHGSVSFYETDEQAEDGDGVDIVEAWGNNPSHPHEWAARIAEHYRTRTGQAHVADTQPHS